MTFYKGHPYYPSSPQAKEHRHQRGLTEETKTQIAVSLRGRLPWNTGLTKVDAPILSSCHKGHIPWNKVGLTAICAECGDSFPTAASYLKNGRHKCCSVECAGKYRSKYHRIVYPKLEPSPDLSYAIGVIIGDGCVCGNNVILSVTDERFALSFQATLVCLGLHPRLNVSIPKGKLRFYFRVTAMSKTFAEWYRSLSHDGIASIARSSAVSFLRGFYEAEGTASGNRLCVVNTQPWKIEIYQELVESLGFKTSHLSYPRIPPKRDAHELHVLGGRREQARFLHCVNPCIKWGRHGSSINNRI